jgi:hypothetical protein
MLLDLNFATQTYLMLAQAPPAPSPPAIVVSNITPYLNLVTSEHQNQPNYTAMLTAVLQPLADASDLIVAVSAEFDLDVAVGSQLDIVGQWIGLSRYLETPITNVYFSLDSVTLGLDFGSLQGPFDPNYGLTALPDDSYRVLLRAGIIVNQWDGTIPEAYAAWAELFAAEGFNIIIQNDDANPMHIIYGLTGPSPDAITLALFTGGYLNLVPAGVEIDSYEVNSFPYFALDSDTFPLGGLDDGGFGVVVG